jgi:hypothetical protein
LSQDIAANQQVGQEAGDSPASLATISQNADYSGLQVLSQNLDDHLAATQAATPLDVLSSGGTEFGDAGLAV